jgi:predicted porin
MANSVKVDERAASLVGKDQKMLGLGLNYDLSKRTTAYVRYEDYNTDKSSTSSGGKGVKTQAFGLMHQF